MASVAQIIRRRRRRRIRRSETRVRNRKWLLLVGIILLVLVVAPASVLFGGVATVYARAIQKLPNPQETIYLDPVVGATEIYDASQQTLLFAVQDPLGDQRGWISLDELPEYVGQATLLWEDPNFSANASFDPLYVLDRLWSNLLNGPLDADPSLTGRLVRNVIAPATDYVTADDRGLEIALIAEINRRYSPEKVLEWHLNTNYYGNEAYGIEAAAQVYLGKSARELTLDEAALLAAIPTAPRFNPVDDETAARGRQSDLLRRMLAAGFITQSQFEQVIHVNTPLRPDAGQSPLVAPDFAIYARRQAEAILNSLGWDGAQMVSRGGLRITTTLDLDLYYQAECMLRTHLARLAGEANPQVSTLDGSSCFGAVYLPAVGTAGSSPPDSGVIVIMDATTGEVKAMVGPGTRTTYQPGPVLHPFVYLTGMLNNNPNYTAASMLLDIPGRFPGAADGLLYIPNNPDEQFRGPLSLRQAMGAGLLTPAVQVANILNLNNVLRTARQMGINSLREGLYDLSLLEKGGGVSVLEIAHAYSIFASLGDIYGLPIGTTQDIFRHRPAAIKRIEDGQGNVLWDYNQTQIALHREPRLASDVAYIINNILADRSTRWGTLGLGNPLELRQPAAAVNGLTGNRVDNWTVGYTPQVVIGVHLGRENRGELSLQNFGVEGAAPVWRGVMDYLYARDSLPAAEWPRPETIVQADVCVVSGMSPNGVCETQSEIFLEFSQIPPEDTYWQTVEVNSQTGLRTTPSTAAALRDLRRYFIPPPEAMDWWRANNQPLPPETYDTASTANIFSSAAILQPGNFDIVGGVVDVRGTIEASNIRHYQLSYGRGPSNPSQWFNITDEIESYTPGTSLGRWDTTALDGTYVLRLSVLLADGTRDTGTVQVIVDNIPPTIVLTAGEPGQVYRWPEDSVIPLVAEVTDNIRIDRVEFYHNGQFVGVDDDYPFGYSHNINRVGIEIFTAVAFDAVGNQSSAELQVEVERSG